MSNATYGDEEGYCRMYRDLNGRKSVKLLVIRIKDAHVNIGYKKQNKGGENT